ncbi:MerR family transcriptional regulator [Litorivita sp. NS0012-18]|uniref:MerR family transcriptional regulator n=1 Tax=Litorivita sp. NS0012-18 TaxID=3127655 RepID=UPI0031029F07
MRISGVANRTGLPISTIRYYEKRGIIPKPKRIGRDRVYSQRDLRAVEFVRDAQALGLKLAEISTLLRDRWGNAEMAEVAAKHRQTIRERIATLERIDKILAALETCRCDSFADCDVTAARCKRDD